jgi:uncharacterized protein (TIGR02266 family)
MGADQRRFLRKTLAVQFSARDGSGTGQLLFTSVDVSAGGAFLKSDLLLEVGEALSLEFSVDGGTALLRAQARVAWVRRFPEANEPAGMGVEFTIIREDERAALEAFLRAT